MTAEERIARAEQICADCRGAKEAKARADKVDVNTMTIYQTLSKYCYCGAGYTVTRTPDEKEIRLTGAMNCHEVRGPICL